uniref:Putative secreted protein n=1 Tax=Ixodes ricinus TaxID=34613 RepID=A0A6B0U2X6_IXORI
MPGWAPCSARAALPLRATWLMCSRCFCTLSLTKASPLDSRTNWHLGNQRACSSQGSSPRSQLHRPPSQWKHLV